MLIGVVDEESRLQGYLAIDSMINGRCYGGVRMVPNLSPATLAEVAQAMTLKHGFLGLPFGGAKAAIVANPEAPLEEKRQLLKAFGRALMPFLKTRTYVPSGELGLTDDDIRFMLTSNGSASGSQATVKRLKVICGANTSYLADNEWIGEKTPLTLCDVRVSPSNSVKPNVGAIELAEALSRVLPFTARDDSRPVLQCVNFVAKEGMTQCSARRLAKYVGIPPGRRPQCAAA